MSLDVLSEVHRVHIASLRRLPAIVDAQGLRLGAQYVMFFAEAELMHQHATHLVDGVRQPAVLEVGLGLGVFAEQLANVGVTRYTAIEPHDGVARLTQDRVLGKLGERAVVITEPWQLAVLSESSYDAIMYDTWPPDGHADSDFALFVERVVDRCLRPGGRFSFFHSGSELPATRRAVLDRHFAHWTTHRYTMPEELTPAKWTKPTRDFLIPVATKGSG